MSSFINKKTDAFNEAPEEEVLLKKRSDGRMKSYTSVVDSRAWSEHGDERRTYLLDLVRRNYGPCNTLPMEDVIQLISSQQDKGDCKKLQQENDRLRKMLENQAKPGERTVVKKKDQTAPAVKTKKPFISKTFNDVDIVGKATVSTSTSSLNKQTQSEKLKEPSSTIIPVIKVETTPPKEQAVVSKKSTPEQITKKPSPLQLMVETPLNQVSIFPDSSLENSSSNTSSLCKYTDEDSQESLIANEGNVAPQIHARKSKSSDHKMQRILELERQLAMKRKNTKDTVDHLKGAFSEMKEQLEKERAKNCALTCQFKYHMQSMHDLRCEIMSIKAGNCEDKLKIRELCEVLRKFAEERDNLLESSNKQVSGSCMMHTHIKTLERELAACQIDLENKEKCYESLLKKFNENQNCYCKVEELAKKTIQGKEELKRRVCDARRCLKRTIEKLKKYHRLSHENKRLSQTVDHLGNQLETTRSQMEMNTDHLKNQLETTTASLRSLEIEKKSLEDQKQAIQNNFVEIQKSSEHEKEELMRKIKELQQKVCESEDLEALKKELCVTQQFGEQLQEQKNHLEQEVDFLKQYSADVQKTAKNQIAQLQSEKQMLAKRSSELERQNSVLKTENQKNEKSISNLLEAVTDNQMELQSSKEKMQEAQQKVATLQEKVLKVTPKGDFSEIKQQKEEIVKLKNEIDALNDQLKKLRLACEEDVRKAAEEKALLAHTVDDLENKNAKLLENMMNMKRSSEMKISKLEEEKSSLVHKVGETEYINEDLKFLENENANLKEEISKLLKELMALETRLALCENNKKEEIASLKNYNEEIREKASHIANEKESLLSKIEDLNSEISALKKKMDEDSVFCERQTNKLQTENETLKSRLAALQKEWDSLKTSTQNNISDACTEMQQTITELAKQLTMEEQRVADLDNSLAICNEKRKTKDSDDKSAPSVKIETKEQKKKRKKSYDNSSSPASESANSSRKASTVEVHTTDCSKCSVVHSKEPRKGSSKACKELLNRNPKPCNCDSVYKQLRLDGILTSTPNLNPKSKDCTCCESSKFYSFSEKLASSRPPSRKGSSLCEKRKSICSCEGGPKTSKDRKSSCCVDVNQGKKKIQDLNENLRKLLASAGPSCKLSCRCDNRPSKRIFTEVMTLEKPFIIQKCPARK